MSPGDAGAPVGLGVDALRAAGLSDHVVASGVDRAGPFVLLDADAPPEACAVLVVVDGLRVEQEPGTYGGDW